ncbi:MAG: DnaA/Hda family protein, partial [Bacteroidales bacterium]|nr:DnaA/Hda family protein [Bacteroidales bacterium]
MTTDHNKVWSNCLEIIKANIAEEAFKTFFQPIIPVRLENNVLIIQLSSHFIREYIEDKYLDILSKALKTELGSSAKLEYQIVVDQSRPSHLYMVNVPTANVNKENSPIPLPNLKTVPNPYVTPGLGKLKIDSQLNEEYSFDNFIEGDCNRLARSAGFAIAQNPGKTAFNPFFIHSKTGLGKSHLCQAIGLEVKNRFPEKTVLYVSAEQFMHQFVEASTPGKGNQADFINFYQMIDVLIVDDIQCLSGRVKTQDVFFHIFNHL